MHNNTRGITLCMRMLDRVDRVIASNMSGQRAWPDRFLYQA